MTTPVKEKEREFLIECIRLYHSLPALWKMNSKDYHDRSKKKMAYDLLLKKYREMLPEATKDDLKKKFNSLRTNYRKEVRKQMEYMKSGDSSDSLYEPRLWYFNEMNFLQENETACESESSMDTTLNFTPECSAEPLNIKYEQDDLEKHFDNLSTSDDTDDCRVREKAQKTLKKPASKKAKNDDNNKTTVTYEDIKDRKDECYYWAMSCAADLRKMDLTQQIYAKKAIAEILMEGRLGQLHRNSVKINEPLTEFCSVKSNPL